MRILLTNSTLADRSGSELYLRDLAIALRRRGHDPIAYSPLLGDVAGDLRDATIPVTNDLRTIKVAPDVIHGQHHLEMMTALAHFPHVPAVYVCHGWLPWQEAPPSHPRILRYVAVDDTVFDRLVIESGIDPARVQKLYNFVDLTRFAQRGPLPAKPRRALVYNSRVSDENLGDVVREVCGASGIDVDVLGYGADRPVREPERLLAQYDVVFARARSALEAMAVGCAVIVCDPSGIAGLVTTKNFDAMRSLNFGVRTLTRPVRRDVLAAEIVSIDAEDAQQVSLRVRAEADMEKVVAAYEELYGRLVTESRADETGDAEDREALADYLRWLSLQTKLPGFVEWNQLKKRYNALALDAAMLRSRLHPSVEPANTYELQRAEGDIAESERQMRGDLAALRKRVERMQRGPVMRMLRWMRKTWRP
jgi:glycosyltransferase involved in cell wall biosynthesis